MSLIADSLKKAVKEKSRGKAAKPDVNLLRGTQKGSTAKERLGSVRQITLLIILPGIVLVYLIYAGAFDERRTRLTDLPLWQQLGLVEDSGSEVADQTPFSAPAQPVEVVTPVAPPIQQAPPALPEVRPEEAPAKPKAVPGAKKFSQTDSVVPAKPNPQARAKTPVVQAPSEPEMKKKSAPPVRKSVERSETRSTQQTQKTPTRPVESKIELPPRTSSPTERVPPTADVFRNSDYHLNRAIFFQQSGEWEKALQNYTKAAELNPDNPDIYNNKGVIYKELGQYDQAIEEFLRAVYLKPDYGKAYNNIGVVYYLKKNYNGAIQNYQKAIEIDPGNLEALNNLAIIYKNQNQFDKAQLVLNSALRQSPDHSGTNYNLAVLYESQGNIKSAIFYYRRFVDSGESTHPELAHEVRNHLKTLE